MPRSLLLLLAAILSTATAAVTPARANTCCGIMSGKVYCYGGLVFSNATNPKADNVMNVLDLTKSSGTSSSDLYSMWKNVEYDRDQADLTPRTDPQCLVMSDQDRMIINGGYDKTVGGRLPNKNIVYHAKQNKWLVNQDFFEIYYGYRQIYYGSASYVPGKGGAFYGGYEIYINPNWSIIDTNSTVFAFDNGTSRTIGYSKVSYFNIESPNPWVAPDPLTNGLDQFSARHQSVYDPVTNLLLFMGGEFRSNTPASAEAFPRPYNYIKAFNTDTNVWNFVNLTGDMPAPGRIYSTLTLLPSTNRHVLLYGGELNGTVAQDYCFILNLNTRKWTKQTIAAPAGTVLSRSQHSAVSVDDNTVLIMWGIDSSKVGTISILILNTTNPDAITLSSSYASPDNIVPVGPVVIDQSLSTGAKVGIAIGGAAAAILAIAVWRYIRSKKNKENARAQKQGFVKQQQESEHYNTTAVEPMEVDWDEIENNYTEVSTTESGIGYTKTEPSRNLTSTTLSSINDKISTTPLVVNPDGVAMQPNGKAIHCPHSIDPSKPPRVVVPDGGN